MKTILSITCIIACLFGSNSMAQDKIEQDPKAKVILDELSQKAKAYTSIKVDFTYAIENKADGINDSQKGSVWVKGEKYKLDIAGQQIICNGVTLWTFIKDANEVQINSVADMDEDKDALVNPMDIFSLYQKDFKYQLFKEETQKDKVVQIIKLYPINPDQKQYHTIVLNIDKTKKELLSFKILEKDGNIYTYTIHVFKTNIAMDDATFNFDVSKADEVIDLR